MTAKEELDFQLADDLWFIEKARARGEVTAKEYAALKSEAYAKRSGKK
jgi:hypothetical protein